MMRKSVRVLVIFIFANVFLFVSGYSQEDMRFIDNSVFDKPNRTPAVFNHDEHNEKAEIDECNECHHIYEDGKLMEDESSEDQSCSDCHELVSNTNMPSLRKAFHKNCKGCHQDRSVGPVMCGECHLK